MSDIEQFWQAIAAKAGDNRKWIDLAPNLQHAVIQSVNILIQVLNTK
jgi:hypothetical protein